MGSAAVYLNDESDDPSSKTVAIDVAEIAALVYLLPWVLTLLPWLIGCLVWHALYRNTLNVVPVRLRWLHNLFLRDEDGPSWNKRTWIAVWFIVLGFLTIQLLLPLLCVLHSVLLAARVFFGLVSWGLLWFLGVLIANAPSFFQRWSHTPRIERCRGLYEGVHLFLTGTCALPIFSGLFQPQGDWLLRLAPTLAVLTLTSVDCFWYARRVRVPGDALAALVLVRAETKTYYNIIRYLFSARSMRH